MILYAVFPKRDNPLETPAKKDYKIPHAFETPPSSYNQIGQTLLALDATPSRFSQRDLAQEFVFYGCNDRPDIDDRQSILFIGTRGNSGIAAIPSKTRMYISKNHEKGKSGYLFSPAKTSGGIWMEAEAQAQEAHIRLYIDENDNSPSPPIEFKLKQETRPPGGLDWEIGTYKVDNSLLARQRARWVGKDVFLAHHGGKDFESLNQKQRLDFDEKEKMYSCFVQEGDCLVWKDERWQSAVPGEQTQGLTLLQIKRIDSRIMLVNLWNPDGKHRLSQSLAKIQDLAEQNKTLQAFVYVGTKRWNEWIFQVDGKRQTIKPQDWWLRQDAAAGGWKKLATREEIDAFVNLKIRGDLFVVDKILQKDRERFLTGNLFNAARTKMHPIQLPIKQHLIETSSQKTESVVLIEKKLMMTLQQIYNKNDHMMPTWNLSLSRNWVGGLNRYQI